jgi:hypothetical protein
VVDAPIPLIVFGHLHGGLAIFGRYLHPCFFLLLLLFVACILLVLGIWSNSRLARLVSTLANVRGSLGLVLLFLSKLPGKLEVSALELLDFSTKSNDILHFLGLGPPFFWETKRSNLVCWSHLMK